MSEAKATVAGATADLLDTLVGSREGSPLAALRARRAEIAAHIQANYDALLEPADAAGVSRAERGLIALRVTTLDACAPLIEHYRAYVAQQQVDAAVIDAATADTLAAPQSSSLSPRLHALLAHVDLLTKAPDAATPDDLAKLKAQGLSDAGIVTISQLISFVSFQVRTVAGLQLLGGMS